MTEDEIQQRISDFASDHARAGTSAEGLSMEWSSEDFLTLARLATKLGWGMTYRGLSHRVVN